MPRGLVIACALVALAPSAAACVVNETAPPARGVVVGGPPPDPVREQSPTAQRGGSVWIAGYWHWIGIQYTWIPGHWERTQEGRSWHAPEYSMHGGAYVYEPGGWR